MPDEQNAAPFILSPGPHVFQPVRTQGLMRDVLVALVPAIAASVYFFRMQAVIVLTACVASCLFFEWAFEKVTRRAVTLADLSAAVTGVLLALVLPPKTPVWTCILAGLVAIVLTKQIFGGLGCNIFNPALLARAFLMAAFPTILTTWHEPVTLDAVTTATPLGLFKFEGIVTAYGQLFVGNISGSLGETSAVALLIGGAYLLARKVIDYRIPLAYAGTVAGAAFLGNRFGVTTCAPVLFHLAAGGFLLGALFMATDPVTSPLTKKGRWVFGIGCGTITMIIRLWGGLPEGVMYSILFMNACTPLINRITRPRRYGMPVSQFERNRI